MLFSLWVFKILFLFEVGNKCTFLFFGKKRNVETYLTFEAKLDRDLAIGPTNESLDNHSMKREKHKTERFLCIHPSK
jgi:hypothetical protein